MPLVRSAAAVALALAPLSVVPAAAQTAPAASEAPAPDPALTARIDQLPAILRGEGDYAEYFHPSFVAQVSQAQFATVTQQLIAQGGPITGIEQVTAQSPFSATLVLGFRDATASVRISVEPAAPHRVHELLVTGFSARANDRASIEQVIEGLPGSTGFAFARLDAGGPVMLSSIDAERPFAIGSAFKLVILAELIRQIEAGERNWADLVTLDGRPLPGGGYSASPDGTQVTLQELATQMISISDNSATDILLTELGREKVEAMLPVLGIDDPRNRPFLSTLEMFKLKGIDGTADRYLARDEVGRRAMLDGEIAAAPLSAIDPMLFRDGKPVRIDTLEWFITPTELVDVMNWLRIHSEADPVARAVLGKNPGLSPATRGKWDYAGYKGGSEPGVMNMTLLLKGKDGAWYVLTGSWNDTEQGVGEARFAGLIDRYAALAAPAGE